MAADVPGVMWLVVDREASRLRLASPAIHGYSFGLAKPLQPYVWVHLCRIIASHVRILPHPYCSSQVLALN
jgi:hypothetical protein